MVKLRLLAVLFVAFLLSSHAWAEKRVALVIGNGEYGRAIGALPNPPNDARLVANTLRGLDFDVIEIIDGSQIGMKKAISSFGKRLDAAGKDGVGLFFYAGHGVQVKGANYLIPVDAEIETEGDVDLYSINANSVLSMMEFSGVRLSFVILDACRNNPFARGFRSASRGLARLDAPKGSLVAYATAPGNVAADGTGKNSPYTAALVKGMLSGQPVERMFREVRNDVMQQTKKKQTPWESSSLTGGDFYFNPPKKTAMKTAPQPKAVPSSTLTPDMLAWQSIQGSTNGEEIEAFILAFRDSPFAGMARARLKALKKKQQVAAVVVPQPSPPPSQVQPAVGVFPKKPGDTFKDCPDCPEMVVIPSGSFQMGSNDRASNEKPAHQVSINYSLAIGKYEVTQAQWQAVMDNNPSKFKGDNNPVANVSWNDAQKYIAKLSAKTGNTYRLITEAEWEYAARAGTTTTWSCGNTESCLDSIMVSDSNSGDRTAPVGTKAANGFGLHDMHGNVWEWVEDCYQDSYVGTPTDGRAVQGQTSCERVQRSGAFNNYSRGLHPALRNGHPHDRGLYSVGFRIARTLSLETNIKQQAAVGPLPKKPDKHPIQWRTEKIITALIVDELGRRNYERLKRSDDAGHKEIVARYPTYDLFIGGYGTASQNLAKTRLERGGINLDGKAKLMFGPKGTRIIYIEIDESGVRNKTVINLPSGHDKAKDRAAIYAPVIKKIADLIIEDHSPLTKEGWRRSILSTLRLVEAEF